MEHPLGKPDLSIKDFPESDFKLSLNDSRVGTYVDALETSDKPSAELSCTVAVSGTGAFQPDVSATYRRSHLTGYAREDVSARSPDG